MSSASHEPARIHEPEAGWGRKLDYMPAPAAVLGVVLAARAGSRGVDVHVADAGVVTRGDADVDQLDSRSVVSWGPESTTWSGSAVIHGM